MNLEKYRQSRLAHFNATLEGIHSPTRFGPDGKITYDFSRLETRRVFAHMTHRLLLEGDEKERQSAFQELQRRKEEGLLTADELFPIVYEARAFWISYGAGMLSTRQTRKEAESILGMIHTIMPPDPETESATPLSVDRQKIHDLQRFWQHQARNSFTVRDSQQDPHEILQFLTKHAP